MRITIDHNLPKERLLRDDDQSLKLLRKKWLELKLGGAGKVHQRPCWVTTPVSATKDGRTATLGSTQPTVPERLQQ